MELEIRDMYQVIRKRIWLINAIILISALIAGLVSYYYLDPVYSASTKIIVNKSEQVDGQERISSDIVRYNLLLVNTYEEIIKSIAIMQKVAEQHPEFHLSAQSLVGRVHVSSIQDTQVITLTVEDGTYLKAAQIVNAVTQVFKEQIPQIMKVDNVMILNQAQTDLHPSPIKPTPIRNITVAIVVSAILSIGLAFLIEYLDDTLKTEEDIRQCLKLPVLASIRRIHKNDFKNNRRNRGQFANKEGTYANVVQ